MKLWTPTRHCALLLLVMSLDVRLAEAIPPADRAEWTILVYMVGDNDLEDYVTADIEDELAAVGSSADVNVVVLADRIRGYSTAAGNWTGTKLFHVTPGMLATPAAAVADLGEQNMGDPDTLVDFLAFSKNEFPADKYALILWDHGWGWRPYQTLWDETNDDTLDLHELVAVLEQTGPLDVIAYDACLMAGIEVLASLRPYADIFVGSQDYVSCEGFRYEEALTALAADPQMSSEELGIVLASSMRDRSTSTILLNEDFDALVAAVDQWSQALLAGLPANRARYAQAFRSSQTFGDPLFVDLYDVAKRIKSAVRDPAIQNASQRVMEAVDKVLIYEWHRAFFPGANGISIFWPQTMRGLDEPSSPQWNDFAYYQDYLSFSATTGWDEFIAEYVNRGPKDPVPTRRFTLLEQEIEAVRSGAAGFGVPARRGW